MLSKLIFLLTMNYERAWVFYAAPVILIILLLLIRKSFVQPKDLTPEEIRRRKRRLFWKRFLFFWSRLALFFLLLIAFAGPFMEESQEVEGIPRVTILVDKSDSMNMFDTSGSESLIAELKKRVPVQVFTIGSGKTSDLGDGILTHMTENTPVLLVSDGQITKGTGLFSVSQFAGNINASLSAVELSTKTNDVSVHILGPSKALEDVENDFVALVTSQEKGATAQLKVEVDGRTVVTESLTLNGDVEVPFTASFQEGDHTLKATLTVDGEDQFTGNNQYHKTVHIVDKPKILVVTDYKTPTLTLLKQVYDVTVAGALVKDLSSYGAIVLHDRKGEQVSSKDVQRLADYLNEGNGVVSLGGLNSFDLGKYEQYPIGSLMPVQIGSGEEREGNSYVVILIDISKSTKGDSVQEVSIVFPM